jgi:hypothetical protein
MANEQVKSRLLAGFEYMLRHFGKSLSIQLKEDPISYDPDTGEYVQNNVTHSNIRGILLKKRKTAGSPEYLPDIYYKAMFRESDLKDFLGFPDSFYPRLGDYIVDGQVKYTVIEATYNTIVVFICKKE